MMSNEPRDAAVRREALTPSRSFIVQAPAGSGKTELLSQRYLTLLGLAEEPEEIVAITFTKKAAGEMRDRVLNAIRAAQAGETSMDDHTRATIALGASVLSRDRERGWGILDSPSRLRIQTIDSFSHSIVQQVPLDARFGAVMGIAEDEATRDRLCMDAAFSAIKLLGSEKDKNDAIARVLTHLDNNVGEVAKLVAAMLKQRDQWERHISGNDPKLLRDQFEAVLGTIVCDALRRVDRLIPRGCRDELVDLARWSADTLSGPKNMLEACVDLDRMPECSPEACATWIGIRKFLLTNTGSWRKRHTDIGFERGTPEQQRFAELLKALMQVPGLESALLALDKLPGTRFENYQWEVLEALLTLLPIATAELRKLFRERSTTDFIEVAQAASNAIERCRVGKRLPSTITRMRHLLVDEFQDTSVMQWRLLRAVTDGWKDGDGRTLFLVGDPMQSIYRFRQAEVGLFLQARQKGLGELKPKSLVLTVNFRSDAALVDWFNEKFEGIFGDRDDATRGLVKFSQCDPGPRKPGGLRPRIFWAADESDEASRVVDLVRDALARPDENQKGIAILVRARSHLASIIAELRKAGIRFQAVDIEKLGERAVISDLVMLTRALLHPADRAAWIAVLRAPWCGLTLNDLYELCRDHDVAIWTALNDSTIALSTDGARQLERVRPVLRAAIETAGRKSLRERVEGAWIALGGPACIRETVDVENAEAYFDMLDDLAREGEPAAEELAAALGGLFAKPDSSDEARVKILTVHKAKGLEFDTVIVPGLGRAGQRDSSRLLIWEERPSETGTELLLAPITQKGAEFRDPIYQYLRTLESERAVEETKRLLYVAVTRARKQLYLVAVPKLKEDGNVRKDGSLLWYLWPSVAEEYRGEFSDSGLQIAASSGDDDGEPSSDAKERQPIPIHRLPDGWQLPPGPSPVCWTAEQDSTAVPEFDRVTYDWAKDRARRIGTVVHAMLQRVARDGAANWNASKVAASRTLFRTALAGQGLAPADVDGAAAEVERALVQILQDAKGCWTLAPHSEAGSEYALSGVLDGQVRHFKFDRTFVDENGTRWIIDFKTSTHEGGDLQQFLDNEQERYRAQLENYARLMREVEQRTIKLGLYFPLLRAWREWEYESSGH